MLLSCLQNADNMVNFARLLKIQRQKSFQLKGALPPDPLTLQKICHQTPTVDSCSALAIIHPPHFSNCGCTYADDYVSNPYICAKFGAKLQIHPREGFRVNG